MADENNNEIIRDSHNKLKLLLRNLFQFDTSDLDFGIYRIMHHKKKEIEKFIEVDLMGAIEEQFKDFAASSLGEKEKSVEELREKIRRDLGEEKISWEGEVDEKYRDLPVVRDYNKARNELKSSNLTQNQVNDVFNLVNEFFSRYFDKGDFLSKRRYGGKNHYTIPYNGEEVLLHWANRDQYYIKTGEHFRNYSFNIGNSLVSFKVKGAETESNNNKGENRYFILIDEDGIQEGENRSLTIWFHYRGLLEDEKKKRGTRGIQDDLLKEVVRRIEFENYGLKTALLKKDEKGSSLLETHLNRYVVRNTTDYFIHKDLYGFLNRELDFFIKNEVLDLDEMDSMDEKHLKISMARAKAIRGICQKVIDFLAQIEDFQKRLFEKKKFVIKTDYCMTLDKVPEDFYEEIGRNEKQVEEWKRLFRLDEITNESFDRTKGKNTLSPDFVKSHKSLVLDTKFFPQEFKDNLLACFNNIDNETGGLIIKSENFQALNLLMEKFREKVKCIYIDPPYNTGNDEFIYKDNYQHSSWLAMMENKLIQLREALQSNGGICISIDDNEASSLNGLMKLVFGSDNFISQVVVQSNPRGRQSERHIAATHEYLLLFAKNFDDCVISGAELSEEQLKEYRYEDRQGKKYRLLGLRQRGAASRREDRPKMFYPIYVDPATAQIYTKKTDINQIEVLPKKSTGEDGRWMWSVEKVVKDMHLLEANRVSGRNEYDIFVRDYLYSGEDEKTTKFKSIWIDKGINYQYGKEVLKKMFGSSSIEYPKPTFLIENIIRMLDDHSGLFLDSFAGSGTTAHAILNLNTEDEGNRKYILVEMGDYFDTVLKPRIQKVMYSREWNDAKPVSDKGISHMFKYQYIEQYEDTLNNIAFSGLDRKVQETLEGFDDYFLRYMLDYETRESPTRLAVKQFENPFDYKLKITSGNEDRTESIDLVETFNYLLGLHIERIRTFEDNNRKYRVVFGRKGINKISVIWRNTEDIDHKRDKEFVENTVLKAEKFDIIYVNGDSFISNALPIEPEFKRLMGA